MQLKNLKTKFIGRNFIFHDEIDSTQSEIWRLVQNKNIENGILVMSDIQTKGKGTHGRIWHTDEANNIAFSLFIGMDFNIKKLEGLTIKIAQIIVDIFESKYGIKIEIKEPNDITYNKKKIGGILTETKLVSEQVKYLVVGIGINTNKEKFSKDIKDFATSVKKEFNIEIDSKEFVAEFCNEFEKEIIKRSGN